MKRVIDTTEVLGTVDMPEGKFEVCAAAEANFDEEGNRLVVRLSATLRSTDLLGKEKKMSASWLPVTETVTESVGASESHDLSREIFHRWVRKVRQVTPALHGSTF
jgi:hypothetical protein